MTRTFIVKNTPYGGNSLAYEVTNLGTMSWDINTPVSPMPLPEDSHKENMLVKMEGNSAQMSLSWTLLADDVTNFGSFDKTTLTFTRDTVSRTVFQEMEYFKTDFVPENINDAYAIYYVNDEGSNELVSEPEEGTIASMRFNVEGNSPVVWNVNMSYLVGNVIAMFEADVPEAPSKVEMSTTGTTKEVKVEWTPYDGYASSSDATTITGLFIEYKEVTGNDRLWTEVEDSMVSGSTTADRLGCEDCATPLNSPNYRIITFNDAGTYRIRLSLSSAATGDSNVRHKTSAKDPSNNNIVLAVT